MYKDKVLLFISIFLLISCARESNTSGVTLHPVPEKMPYSNIESEMLHIHDAGEVIDIFPESVKLLYDVLNQNENNGWQNTEPILLSSGEKDTLLTTGNIDVSSVSDSSLLILEINTNRLIQYNIDEKKYHIIANQGRGPGDLYFSRELSVYGNNALIAMQGFQISKFTCNNGLCEYSKTMITEYNNYSVALDEKHIFFLGISAFGREGDPDPTNADKYLIHKINDDNEILLSYLPMYRDRSPLIREAMNSGGKVRLFPDLSSTIVTFSMFPYLYMHNDVGELIGIYELPEFIQNYYESVEDRSGRLSSRLLYDSNTTISHSSILEKRWLLLKMREVRDLEYHGLGKGFTGTNWYSYYVFDVTEKNLYKIGDGVKKPVSDARRELHVVDQGIIINENGLLYLLLNNN